MSNMGRCIAKSVLRYTLWRIGFFWRQAPLGHRFALLMFLVILLLLLLYQWFSLQHLKEALYTQQKIAIQTQLKTAQTLLDRDTEDLLRICEDYSAWEELCDAIEDRNTKWIRINVVDRPPPHFYLDTVAVFDKRGEVVLSTPYLPRPLRDKTYPLFRKALEGTSGAGFLRISNRIYQVAYAPIVGENDAPPQTGVLLMAKRLDEARLTSIWNHLGTRVELIAHDSQPNDASLTAPKLIESNGFTQAILPLYDVSHQAIGSLRVLPQEEQIRLFQQSVAKTQRYLVLAGLAITLFASVVMIGLLRRHLQVFMGAVHQLAQGNWNARVPYPARDEFGLLARAFNQMAEQLQSAFEKQSAQRQEIELQKEELEYLYQQLQSANRDLERLNRELLETNQQLAQQASTDGLTGLKNHRAFHESLHSAIKMAERFKQPLSLIMFDIDHFKQFNDTYGHPAGDELLRQVGAILQQSARAYDIPARYGGEEFAVILPNTDADEAVQVAERLRQQISAIQNPHAPITASFGVSTYRPGSTPAILLYEADSALYQAKQSGRNCVVLYRWEPPSEVA